MAEQLKHIYSVDKITAIADALKQAHKHFDKALFLKTVFDEEWEDRALKERMHHIADTLHTVLTGNYEQKLEILLSISTRFSGFEYMLFPRFCGKIWFRTRRDFD